MNQTQKQKLLQKISSARARLRALERAEREARLNRIKALARRHRLDAIDPAVLDQEFSRLAQTLKSSGSARPGPASLASPGRSESAADA